jgi:hypothetical protein
VRGSPDVVFELPLIGANPMKEQNTPTPTPAPASLSVLRWIVDEAEQAPAILSYLEQLVTATATSDRWVAFKALGDLVVADLESFLQPSASESTTTAQTMLALGDHPVVKANGQIIDLLLANLPQILTAIETILALFGKGPSPAA